MSLEIVSCEILREQKVSAFRIIPTKLCLPDAAIKPAKRHNNILKCNVHHHLYDR